MKNSINNSKIMLLVFCGLVLLSILLWIIFRRWHAGLWHWLGIYLTEWGMRAWKLKDYWPPVSHFVFDKLVKSRKSKVESRKSAKMQDLQVADAATTRIKVHSIGEWLVKNMIAANCNNDYSAIGSGPGAEEQYHKLVYQYLDAKADDEMNEYKRMLKRRILLANQVSAIETNCEILKTRYCETAAHYLRQQQPKFPYSKDSHVKDAENMLKSIVSKRMELQRIEEQVKKFNGATAHTGKTTAQKKEEQVTELLLEINKNEGVRYDLKTMTVLELAIGEKRIARKIKSLKEQLNNARPNK